MKILDLFKVSKEEREEKKVERALKRGQEKLIDPEDLVKYIISDVEKRESGEIVVVKNL